MEGKSNITLKLGKDLLRAVKVLAAKRGTSISAYVAETLTEAMKQEDSYEDSKRRAIALMNESRSLGWKKPKSRDELYER